MLQRGDRRLLRVVRDAADRLVDALFDVRAGHLPGGAGLRVGHERLIHAADLEQVAEPRTADDRAVRQIVRKDADVRVRSSTSPSETVWRSCRQATVRMLY